MSQSHPKNHAWRGSLCDNLDMLRGRLERALESARCDLLYCAVQAIARTKSNLLGQLAKYLSPQAHCDLSQTFDQHWMTEVRPDATCDPSCWSRVCDALVEIDVAITELRVPIVTAKPPCPPEEREKRIRRILATSPKTTSTKLAEMLGVSRATICDCDAWRAHRAKLKVRGEGGSRSAGDGYSSDAGRSVQEDDAWDNRRTTHRTARKSEVTATLPSHTDDESGASDELRALIAEQREDDASRHVKPDPAAQQLVSKAKRRCVRYPK